MEKQKIQLRRSTSEQWTLTNVVLGEFEPAVETDTGKFKIGDGVTPWILLPYVGREEEFLNMVRDLSPSGAPFQFVGGDVVTIDTLLSSVLSNLAALNKVMFGGTFGYKNMITFLFSIFLNSTIDDVIPFIGGWEMAFEMLPDDVMFGDPRGIIALKKNKMPSNTPYDIITIPENTPAIGYNVITNIDEFARQVELCIYNGNLWEVAQGTSYADLATYTPYDPSKWGGTPPKTVSEALDYLINFHSL